MVTKTHIKKRHGLDPELWAEPKWGSVSLDIIPKFPWGDDILNHSLCQRPFQIELTGISMTAFASAIVSSALLNIIDNINLSLNDVYRFCKAYADQVSALPYVIEIALVEHEGSSTIWTIIDSPPFDDSVRLPIYDAQFHVLRTVPEGLSLNFRTINVQEISESQDPKECLPANRKTIWWGSDVTKAVSHR